MVSALFIGSVPIVLATEGWQVTAIIAGCILLVVLLIFSGALGMRYIPNNRVGIVEKMWAAKGSVKAGRILALDGEAGYQAELLRGGLHLFFWRWQYRIHISPLVTIPQGKIGYVYARDGQPLAASQTLGKYVDCNNFQDARAFLDNGGQRGRQRTILREGVYAINQALFVVIAEDVVYHLEIQGKAENEKLLDWQNELRAIDAFNPVVIGKPMEAVDPFDASRKVQVDSIGIVTVHDGPSLAPGEIIAPSVGNDSSDPHFHNNYQDTEAFLAGGGRRGRQYVPLTDGTYFINRWFATIEMAPKTIVPIGYVGVVISYYGPYGKDLSGEQFRHGERVARGERGVWERPLGPGKYPFNGYAGKIVLVPTTNFVLNWMTDWSEEHKYDETLESIDLVTKDAYEPKLPLSVVVHIDYMKASSVVQRFGDVKRLITQTLDPMLSAYFRDVAHRKTMLEILHERAEIQKEARDTLQQRFREFDIECVDVLIGKPDTAEAAGKIEVLLEQLRQRQLSIEQIQTYERQSAAAEQERVYNEKRALAAKQQELTNSQVQIQIAENQGDADLARSRKQAEQAVVVAKAESESRILSGRGESQRIMQIGLAEAAALMQKISSYGDPRLYALSAAADYLSKSAQPLVPQQLFVTGASGENGSSGAQGLLGTLISLLVAEKSGFSPTKSSELGKLREFVDRMSAQAIETMQQASAADTSAAKKPVVPRLAGKGDGN